MLELKYKATKGTMRFRELPHLVFKAQEWTPVDDKVVRQNHLDKKRGPKGELVFEIRTKGEEQAPAIDAQVYAATEREKRREETDKELIELADQKEARNKARDSHNQKLVDKARKKHDAKVAKENEEKALKDDRTPEEIAIAESIYDKYGPLKGQPAWEYYTGGEKSLMTRRRNQALKHNEELLTQKGPFETGNNPPRIASKEKEGVKPTPVKEKPSGPTLGDALND